MTLYLGLNHYTAQRYQAHFFPILQITPYAKSSPQIKKAQYYFPLATHIILTSPSSSVLFLSKMLKTFPKALFNNKSYLCLGQATKKRIQSLLPKAQISLATEEISEGFFSIIKALPKDAFLLYPHSALARPVIKKFLIETNKNFYSYPHYSVKPRSLNKSLFTHYDHIILTSPSSVRAYSKIFPKLPQKHHWCQGPITLQEFQTIFCTQAKLLKHWDTYQ
ncbi:uroporphyrinogen-III synthase [Chlamydia sp. 17-3921]|uniref:uroporphyrinogen-III synthase n=1 Tax=Chlamydia sp. 17-3921 TaxID=2675798 RepID=UPI00191B32E1|nr:uroporphyrinogen-III synthase [Chlamydia sp. 17-3921]